MGEGADSPRMTPLPRGSILAACCAGMMTMSFVTAAPAVFLADIGADLGMDLARKGLFLSATAWGFTAAVLLAGPLADRVGFRALLVGSSGLVAVGLAVMASADSQWAAVAGGVIAGTGCGIADGLFTPVVCAVYPDRRTHASNLLHAFYPAGLIVTIGLVLVLMKLGWSWRGSLGLLAGAAAPFMLLFALLPLPTQSHPPGQGRLPTRRIALTAPFALLAAGMLVAGLTEITPAKWLPSFVLEATDGGRFAGGVGLLIFAATMTVGRLACTMLLRRIGPMRLLVGGTGLCAAGLGLSAVPLGLAWTVGTLALVGFGVASLWPTLLGLAGDRFPQAGASLYSLLSAFGCLGAVVGPWAFGLIADASTQRVAMAVSAAAPAVGLLLMFRVGRFARE